MPRFRHLALIAGLAAILATPAMAEDLKVMSFNVRTMTGNDGLNVRIAATSSPTPSVSCIPT